MAEEKIITSGAVFETQFSKFVLVYFVGSGKYGCLYIFDHEKKGMTCPMFYSDKEGNYQFTEEELLSDIEKCGWKRISGRLKLEIDEPNANAPELKEVNHGN